MAITLRHLVVGLLLFSGGALWFVFGRSQWWYSTQFIVLALQIAFSLLPAVNRWISNRLDSIRILSPRAKTLTALSIGVLGMGYLFLSAIQQKRDLFPKYHDESMHLIQARQLAGGHLWMPPHELPQFFETFHVFVTPVYAAMQFPGTSLLYVPGIWLHLPYWITPLAIAGVCIGLLFRIVSELIDGVAGVLASIMLLGTLEFRYLSVMVLSNSAALLLGLCMVWAWLRWRSHQTATAACCIGAFAGWAAITRPPDAVCFALPIGIAMAHQLFHRSPKAKLTAALCLIAGAAPFLLLQLYFNQGVTGHWFDSPHERYVRTFHPGGGYGSPHDKSTGRPQTTLQQKLDYYDGYITRDVGRYSPSTAPRIWIDERLPKLFKASLPNLLFISLLPCGLLGIRRREIWVVVGVCPLFIAFYAFSIFFASQYCLINAAALIPLALLGAREIEGIFPNQHRILATTSTIAIAALSFTQLPQFNPAITEQYESKTLSAVESALKNIPGRAVVFFRYQRYDNVHEEPVYNIEAADIDSQRIVRAQDLGPTENPKLIRYYAQWQPDRQAYLFNRADRTLTKLPSP